ncbi:MAG: lytic transglycosylase domain-containing protein [Bacteroidota bacterium]
MNSKNRIVVLGGATLFCIALASTYTSINSKDTDPNFSTTTTLKKGVLPQMIKSVDLNKSFDFAGEAVPMKEFDAYERLDRELTSNTYRHGNTSLNLKKAARYFPIIEPILAKEGVPDDLKYLAVAESDLSNATSPAGAKGFWQFMTATAKEYGLEVNKEVDERFHLEKSTVAACRLLKNYYKQLGTWTLAAAAYNGGIGRIKKALDRQRADNFYELNLNQETSRYVFRIVAIKEIMRHPTTFGYYFSEHDLYPSIGSCATLEVDTAIENLGDFARKYGISYRLLKKYNPWLLSDKLVNPNRRTYIFKIPSQTY